MTLNDFNPTYDELLELGNRILWRGGDVWCEDMDGVPHSLRTMYGEMLTIKLPDNFPTKYKGRKARKAVIWCSSCETVTGVEIHFTGGRVIAFSDPDSTTYRDVTDYYNR